jgi:hypothetical protein
MTGGASLGERLRRLDHARTPEELKDKILKPEFVELVRVVVPSARAEAEAARRRAAGSNKVTIKPVHGHRMRGSYAAVAEWCELPPLAACAPRAMLVAALEDILRRMPVLGEQPIDRLRIGRAIIMPALSGQMPAGTPPDDCSETVPVMACESPGGAQSADSKPDQ